MIELCDRWVVSLCRSDQLILLDLWEPSPGRVAKIVTYVTY